MHMMRLKLTPEAQAQLKILRSTTIEHDTDPAGFAFQAFVKEICRYWEDHMKDGYTVAELIEYDLKPAKQLLEQWEAALLAAHAETTTQKQSPPI